MSLEMPSELDWLFKIVAGQAWPKGDEDKLRALRDAWTQTGQAIPDVVDAGDAAARVDALARELVARMRTAGWDEGEAPRAVASVLAASAVAVEVDDLGVGAVGVDGDELGVLDVPPATDVPHARVDSCT